MTDLEFLLSHKPQANENEIDRYLERVAIIICEGIDEDRARFMAL